MDLVLVHGSFHGAWCWERLIPALDAHGHRAIAVDLPISEPGLGADAYATVVCRGHRSPRAVTPRSPSSATPWLAWWSRSSPRVDRSTGSIFLAAFLAQPGRSAKDQRQAEAIDGLVPPTTAEWTDLGDDVWRVGPTTATELFFHDASPDVAAWASSRLRPQCYQVIGEREPAGGLAGRPQQLHRLSGRSRDESRVGAAGRHRAARRGPDRDRRWALAIPHAP